MKNGIEGEKGGGIKKGRHGEGEERIGGSMKLQWGKDDGGMETGVKLMDRMRRVQSLKG